MKGELWIIETKGGFDRSGNSQDIDMFTPKKFEVLKKYLDKYGLKGGIVRNDCASAPNTTPTIFRATIGRYFQK